jgi:4-amino-4-deoxy-L-arabinose transferase-like glycosyltransferase
MRRAALAGTPAAVVVSLLALAYVAPYAYATLSADGLRDLLASHAIAHGERFPLVGPLINNAFHLGPAWLYVQAVPLLLGGSAVATMLFVGALAGMKFPLAYRCGAAIGSPTLGVAFAAALALPTVNVFQWLQTMHTNVVESALLLSFACALRWRAGGSARWLYAAALALGLAVQFHPTAFYYLPLLLAWSLADRGTPLAARGVRAIVALAVASVWFWPAIAVDVAAMGRDVAVNASRIGEAAGHATAADVRSVAATMFARLPYAIGETYLAGSPWSRSIWLALLALIATATLAGLAVLIARGERRRQRAALVALALFVPAIAIASSLRSFASFYTLYFALPPIAFVAAAGLATLLEARSRALRTGGVLGLAAIAGASAIVSAGAIGQGRDAFVRSTFAAMGDLRHAQARTINASTEPAALRDALGRFFCRHGAPFTLHGDLAYQVAGSFSLDTLLACGERRQPIIAGAEPRLPDVQLYGLTRGLLEALGRAPEQWIGSMGIGNPVVVAHPARGRPADAEFHYFDLVHDRAAYAPLRLRFETPPAAVVAVYNLKPFDGRLDIESAAAAGAPATLALETFDARFYVAPAAPSANVAWAIDLATDVPQWIDVFAF